MGHNVFAIMNGYQGMVDNNIKQLGWEDVGGILNEVPFLDLLIYSNSILIYQLIMTGRNFYWYCKMYGFYETRRTKNCSWKPHRS